MRLQPKDTVAYYSLSVMLLEKGDVDGAIKECRTAAQLMPEFPPPHFLLGKALQAKGETQAAIDELRKATELDSKNGEYQKAYKKALKTVGQE